MILPLVDLFRSLILLGFLFLFLSFPHVGYEVIPFFLCFYDDPA
jgi:hypothetical protein